jgi:hypothetical protein
MNLSIPTGWENSLRDERCVSHISRKTSEIWGTLGLVFTEE